MAPLSTGMMDAGKKTTPDDNSKSNCGVKTRKTQTASVFRHAQTRDILMRAHNTWTSAGAAIRYQARSPTKPIAIMPAAETILRPAAETAYVKYTKLMTF